MLTNQPKFKIAFLALDIIVLSVSFFWAFVVLSGRKWYGTDFSSLNYSSLLICYLLIIPLQLFTHLYNDLYKRNIIISIYRHSVLIIKSLIISGIISGAVLFFFYYNIGRLIAEWQQSIIAYFTISMIAMIVARAILARAVLTTLWKRNLLRSRLLIVGGSETGRHAAEAIEKERFSSFVIVGFIDAKNPIGQTIYARHRCLGSLNDITTVVHETNPDEILIASDDTKYEDLIEVVERCLATEKIVRVYSNVLTILSEKLKVETYSGLPVIMLSQRPLQGGTWKFKRIIDIILSASGLLIFSPLFALIIIGIKFSSKGPILFKQRRVGKKGVLFDFYKFRSMHVANSDTVHREFVQDYIKGAHNNKNIRIFKIADDPRIFSFGRFIRKTSLDEFPQLYNVLKGDMTLIGPRPCLEYEWECYSPWHKKRLNVLPGCTGLWQVIGRSMVTFEEMVILDLYYISNMSLWFDLKIILKTIPVIFFGKGGH